MPIITFCDEKDEGAVRGETQVSDGNGGYKPSYYWTKKIFVGKCIREREYNGYDDSDFYMLVWDDEINAPREIQFASTRGWTYPCMGSSVDATPEVRAKYEAYEQKRAIEARKAIRKSKASVHLANRKLLKEAAERHGVPYGKAVQIRKLQKSAEILHLFSMKPRGDFKKSLQARLISWLLEDKHEYPAPFSKKQLEYINGPQKDQRRYGSY